MLALACAVVKRRLIDMIKPLILQMLAHRFGGEAFGEERSFSAFSTDTRTVAKGDLFIALKGNSFDAHDYLEQAIEKGASGIVANKTHRENLIGRENIVVWLVDDTTKALGQIGEYHRDLFERPLVAITGSSGKTTVKGMLASIFSAYVGKESVFATRGNLNNHFGVPFSLLELSRKHQYAVIEMGASAGGEIGYLTQIAKPQVALVNNVMAAHVEGFGSVDAIAVAKGEIYNGLSESGTAVINIDDHYAKQWMDKNKERKVITFSSGGASASHINTVIGDDEPNVRSRNASLLKNGCYSFCLKCGESAIVVKLNVLGKHNVANATAAAACAFALGIDVAMIRKGLESFLGESGRLQVFEGAEGSTLVDDTYNANPGSVKAAIDVLAKMPGDRVLVLGDMAELGEDSEDQHAEIGRYALDKKIEQLLTIGEQCKLACNAFGKGGLHFSSIDDLIGHLFDSVSSNVSVLVKGSRSARMERVVHALKRGGDNNNASLAC
jgi:UDP-N-acetylmuramoyl-tripeptide--D-alanyl-D-alanine ligase